MRAHQAALEARNRQLTAEVSCQGHQLQATAVAAVPASARACKHGCRDGWKEDHALQVCATCIVAHETNVLHFVACEGRCTCSKIPFGLLFNLRYTCVATCDRPYRDSKSSN